MTSITDQERTAIHVTLLAFQHDRLFWQLAVRDTDKKTIETLLTRWAHETHEEEAI